MFSIQSFLMLVKKGWLLLAIFFVFEKVWRKGVLLAFVSECVFIITVLKMYKKQRILCSQKSDKNGSIKSVTKSHIKQVTFLLKICRERKNTKAGNIRKILIIVISIEVVIIASCIIFLVYASSNSFKDRRQSETAQHYLLDEKYEQAIAVYETIIEIDPENAEAYLGLAEAYRETEDLRRMLQTLEKGFEKTDSVDIQKLLNEYADSDIWSGRKIHEL